MTRRVLIADDSLTVRMDLQEAFEEAGFEAVSFGRLAEAREAARCEIYDLIVLDLVFPDGSGIDFLEELRSREATAQVPLIFLSTKAAVADRIRGLQAGAHEYAGKPYDRAYVVSRANELLAKREGLPEKRRGSILLIEDSLTYRKSMRTALEAEGYQVAESGSGEDGLRQAAQLRPDAILVDGALPDIDGPTVIQRLRLDPALRTTPCLLLTATLGKEQELRALAAGADTYMRKDEGMALVLARLASVLRAEKVLPADEKQASLFSPKKVLAVDDSETYLQELAEHLRHDGYDVAMAHSGEEALELMAVQSIDCILLDLLMPGLSGQETCRRIKLSAEWRDVPVLMLTAREDREAMIEGINAGADDYIAKSSDFEVVRARLRAQLRRKHFEAENRHIRDELHRKEMEATHERAARALAESRAALMEALEAKSLELEKKNQELDEFASVASHELQAPVRAVRRFADLLAAQCKGRVSAETDEYVGLISDGARRMQTLIDDLLAYARLSTRPDAVEQTDCAVLLKGAREAFEVEIEESGAEVTSDALPEVQGDPLLLAQLFQNLLGNAIKYRGAEPPRVHFSVQEGDDEWRFSVRDNGIGIAPEHREAIFGIFKRLHNRSKYPGTGIGLALCKRVVERHGGRIWVESQVGQGSTFFFTLARRKAGETHSALEGDI